MYLFFGLFFLTGKSPNWNANRNIQADSLCPIKNCVIVRNDFNHVPGIYFTSTDSNEINVKSIVSGKVISITHSNDFNTVVIKKGNTAFCYFYLKNVLVKKNDIISSGKVIGNRQENGKLYIEVFKNSKRVDPLKYLNCR